MKKQRQMVVTVAIAGMWASICAAWAEADTPSTPPTNPASTETLTVSLAHQEVPYSMNNSGLTIREQTTAFEQEPQTGNAEVRRGQLDFQIPNEPPLPFLWNWSQNKLYLDLNRNEDLTDDPAGTFASSIATSGSSSYQYAVFTNIHLSFQTEPTRQPWIVDLNLSDYRGQLNVYAAVRSLWAGKALLAGREWQVGVLDSPQAQRGDVSGGYLLFRPWANRDNSFSVSDGSLVSFPFSKVLFVQTQSYQLDCKYAPEDDKMRCQLDFKEQPTELGELKLTGEFIQRVSLSDGPCLVLIDAPAKAVQVPVGQYGNCQVLVGKDGMVAHQERSYPETRRALVIAKDKPAVVTAGGPLTNSVTVTRRGRLLVFDYRLVGAGGNTYQLATTDYNKPPEFVVYQGDKKIASGNFEFG